MSNTNTSEGTLQGVLLASLTICAWEYLRAYAVKGKWEKAYWGERRGRARVEREMKRISDIQLSTDKGFFVQAIGEISSCYRQCVGTPRQGLLVPASRSPPPPLLHHTYTYTYTYTLPPPLLHLHLNLHLHLI
jgi:hypothetical protein